jgi:hypothetical protein
MLKELNLKLEVLPTKHKAQPLVQSTAMPLPSPTPAPSLGGRIAKTDHSLAGGSLALAFASLGLMALNSCTVPTVPESDSDKGFCWANKNGWDYNDDTKSNT